MKNRMLRLFFITAAMTGCLLTGCGNSGEVYLPEKKETDISVTESAGSESLPEEKETDSSVAELESDEREGEKENANNMQFSFVDISNLEFWFGSGAGAWRTVLTVHADGTFEGEYRDSDMGDRGDGYSHGICYLCNFTGEFAVITSPRLLGISDEVPFTCTLYSQKNHKDSHTPPGKDASRFSLGTKKRLLKKTSQTVQR